MGDIEDYAEERVLVIGRIGNDNRVRKNGDLYPDLFKGYRVAIILLFHSEDGAQHSEDLPSVVRVGRTLDMILETQDIKESNNPLAVDGLFRHGGNLRHPRLQHTALPLTGR